MILSNNNGTFTPVAGGTGTFIGTAAAFNAVKATLPVNTVAYITDDGNGDLQPVDAVTNGDMHPVTSNAVYDKLQALGQRYQINNMSFTIASGGFLDITTSVTYPTDDDVLLIPRWWGDTGLMLVNYWNNNGKVCITLKNITGQSITVQNVSMYFALVYIRGNGIWEPTTASY